MSVAAILSLLAGIEDRFPGDLWMVEAAQRLPDGLEPVADVMRALTATETVLVLGAATTVALWLGGQRAGAVSLALVLVLLPLVQGGLKDLVDRPRPSAALVEIKGGFGSASFPSGHVLSGSLLYGFLAYLVMQLRLPRGWREGGVGALLGIVVANGFANVYVGVHWPSDVMGGYLWALVLLIPAVGLHRRLAGKARWPRLSWAGSAN